MAKLHEELGVKKINVIAHSMDPRRALREPVSAPPKWKLKNGAQRPAPETRPARTEIPEIADQRRVRASLTPRNVADSHTPGNNTLETGLPGCPQRIREPPIA
ncbi:MAG: hypothetical protein DLM68_07840 [Hyphomicrobiales bacterium]|nr:MAG: hypothetical protein DLM68_07840 [Hyphomicrobiales bacterium]